MVSKTSIPKYFKLNSWQVIEFHTFQPYVCIFEHMYCIKLFNVYDHFHTLWHLLWPTLDYTKQKANSSTIVHHRDSTSSKSHADT